MERQEDTGTFTKAHAIKMTEKQVQATRERIEQIEALWIEAGVKAREYHAIMDKVDELLYHSDKDVVLEFAQAKKQLAVRPALRRGI